MTTLGEGLVMRYLPLGEKISWEVAKSILDRDGCLEKHGGEGGLGVMDLQTEELHESIARLRSAKGVYKTQQGRVPTTSG